MSLSASDSASPGRPRRPRRPRRILGLVLVATTLVLALIALVAWCAFRARLYPVAELAHHSPGRTALMNQRAEEARLKGGTPRVEQIWVSYERISPLLRRAVLVAEDDAFFAHGGLDWNEINASMRRNLERRRIVRGGSTITQQLARNIYLGDARTITRKLTEVFLAIRFERELGKRRIFTLYLNLIEWGDGIYGIEAASRHYFGIPASALDARQAVLLAAVIINPRRYSVLAPSKRIERRVMMIAARLHRRGAIDDAQYVWAIGAPVTPAATSDSASLLDPALADSLAPPPAAVDSATEEPVMTPVDSMPP